MPAEGKPGTASGRRRGRNGRARAARWNAGANPGLGRADAAWHRGRSGGAGAKGRGRAGADAGTGGPTPSPKGGDPSLPLHPPETNSRGRRTPPTDSWGVRRPRGGQDGRPIRPWMGPGRRQAPRRPHDAGRPMGAIAGTKGCRRPDRGGRPMLGDGGPSPEGVWEPSGRRATGGERRSAAAAFSDPPATSSGSAAVRSSARATSPRPRPPARPGRAGGAPTREASSRPPGTPWRASWAFLEAVAGQVLGARPSDLSSDSEGGGLRSPKRSESNNNCPGLKKVDGPCCCLPSPIPESQNQIRRGSAAGRGKVPADPRPAARCGPNP